ncbi:MAG TPA: hypothetical protein ENH35_02965 [Candidatus Moranbacteria bacterium]|nr:hypothetical protein [Candidatus Moranbacteria bacterium]
MSNSPMLSLVWKLRQIRNEEQDYRMGRVLTFMESIISNEVQLKATKDMIKSIFYDTKHHSNVDELLRQFKEKFCPKIEDGYEDVYKLIQGEVPPSAENYFPDSK